MANKKPANPLLNANNFKIEDSFGPQPALLAPSGPFQTTTSKPTMGPQPVMKPPVDIGPPQLPPPQPGLFLLPTSTASGRIGPPPPPPSMTGVPSGSKPRSKYVIPPGIHSSISSGNLSANNSPFGIPPSLPPPATVSAMMTPSPTMLANSTSVPDFANIHGGPELYPGQHEKNVIRGGPELYPGQHEKRETVVANTNVCDDPVFHWYFKVHEKSYNVLNPTIMDTVTEQWKPFSMRDSMTLEDAITMDKDSTNLITTDGGRYDVDIPKRVKMPVYWKDGLNDEMKVCRASWFYKSVNTWVPYEENVAEKLEEGYVNCYKTNQWQREIRITENKDSGEARIRMISADMIYHLPSDNSSLVGKLDEWGQVQPPSQDPSQMPREVRRGIEGILDDIPDGEDSKIDHLVFVIHGIGGACDMQFRPIYEVVDTFRESTNSMSKKHFQRAHLMEEISRIEYLPVNWHKPLHGEDQGTDERLKPLTLKSIPKLRNFVNDTLLDILFYTSPIYCQRILDTVVSEINRIYTLFSSRNEDFNGQISIIGHSLGSLIMFDVLSNQSSTIQAEHIVVEKPPPETELTLEQVFAKLNISEYKDNFIREGIDMDSLVLCTEDDLKEGGLPLGPRKILLHYLEVRKALVEKSLSGLEEYQKTSITSDVKYRIGPAGTGQPSVFYPKLDFSVKSFFALGSPIALFHAVRGISELGSNFKLPATENFFNIFHPYDPVAYRMESLINKEYANLRPVTIPHHAGRKRMHLELKETVTKLMTGDLKKKLIDSVWSGLSAIYNTATGANDVSAEEKVNEAVQQKIQEEEALDSVNPKKIDSLLNQGCRIDYVLQEAPYESFNEYVFALGSHLCYWNSEDTILMILKDIYGSMDVLCDEELAQNEAAIDIANTAATSSAPPFVDNTPTAILRPPPIPIGGQMVVESLPPAVKTELPISTTINSAGPPQAPLVIGDAITTSSFLSASSSSIAAPPPPISILATPIQSTLVPPGSVPLVSSSNAIASSAVPMAMPPTMMSLNSTPPPSTMNNMSAGIGRPRRAAYPIGPQTTSTMGMDPTAPSSDSPKSIGPPPMHGFKR